MLEAKQPVSRIAAEIGKHPNNRRVRSGFLSKC
jgi:hypothetical protein